MWSYQKRLQYPINIKNKDLKMAKYLVTQYGGANGELGAALRYLNQRYTMPDNRGKALLTKVYSWLSDSNRDDDLKKSFVDIDFQNKLIDEYIKLHPTSPTTA